MKDEFGKRLKENYEMRARTKLTRRIPVAIRIDGKAFHTFTKNFNRPFDDILIETMQDTTKYLCENVQGCVFGYTQSDEITLILQDYKTLTTEAWLDYQVQKMCSISASMATYAFNRFFNKNKTNFYYKSLDINCTEDDKKYIQNMNNIYNKATEKGAMFDSRVFNIPLEEVVNLVYWRQLDCRRNSVSMVAQVNFSDKELHKKTTNDKIDMLKNQKNIDWNDFPTYKKIGSACIKRYVELEEYTRSQWFIDKNMPLLVNDGRKYLSSLISFDD